MATEATMKRTRGRPRGEADKSGGAVQALERGLVLLTALAKADKATLTDLAMRTGMPTSSAHRLLTTLEAQGYAVFDEATGDWMVGVEAFRTGGSFVRRTDVVAAARDVMPDLVAQTGETANLAAQHDDEVVFLSQIETSNPIRAFFPPGARAHMHASGIGKALLAEAPRDKVERLLQRTGLPEFTEKTLATPAALFADLEAIRTRGWSVDDEERYLGMRCVAAAVRNARGDVVAGVSISGPSARLTLEAVGAVGPLVKRAATDITARIGGG